MKYLLLLLILVNLSQSITFEEFDKIINTCMGAGFQESCSYDLETNTLKGNSQCAIDFYRSNLCFTTFSSCIPDDKTVEVIKI